MTHYIPIKIREVLIQGHKGQAGQIGLYNVSTSNITPPEKNTVNFEIKNDLLQYTVINPKGKLVTDTIKIADLNYKFQKPLTPDQIEPIFRKILKITQARGHTQKKPEKSARSGVIIEDNGQRDPDRIKKITDLINTIATQVKEECAPGIITRAITDEFSFYPENQPFSLDEYKEIIQETAKIAKQLPPDAHMVLATFPVLWPDGGLHNCGLYVEGPQKIGMEPTLHHLSKSNHSAIDYNYQDKNKNPYPFTTDAHCTPAQLPNTILRDTAITTQDINQYGNAIKLSRSDGQSFITTVGICLDHAMGVERTQTHALMDQLQQAGQKIPLHCSHVITSASILETDYDVLSTISHADPDNTIRHPHPGRQGFTLDFIKNPFSNSLNLERYPPKLIGMMHSDLFQHAIANIPPDQLMSELAAQDDQGNTLLHQVFFENQFDRELTAKRLYSMIVNGADPNIKNNEGKTVFDLAIEIDQRIGLNDGLLENTLRNARSWRKSVSLQNTPSQDGYTPLTRLLSDWKEQDSIAIMAKAEDLILNGANPYIKDGHGQSAMDIISSYLPPQATTYKASFSRRFKETQYGHQRNIASTLPYYAGQPIPPPRSNQDWFQPPYGQTVAMIERQRLAYEHRIKNQWYNFKWFPSEGQKKSDLINPALKEINKHLNEDNLEGARQKFSELKTQLSRFKSTNYKGKETEASKLMTEIEKQVDSLSPKNR